LHFTALTALPRFTKQVMPNNSAFEFRRSRGGRSDRAIIVQSHLRWDFVWQRPQQLLSRFAESTPVLFIEEPVFLDDLISPKLDLTLPHANVLRVVPQFPTSAQGDRYGVLEIVRDLAVAELGTGGRLDGEFSNPIHWFYTGMPAPAMLGAFNEVGVVYDCMDELSQFRNAPREVSRRERLLIANADVVFTGGYELYKAKSALHDNVHFFGCGVDAAHFGAARRSETIVPDDARLGRPVAGYFGVIDERLDYGLIARLATALPQYNFVFVGPTAKIDPEELPRRDNIHWLGQRSYDDLPRYVKAFDVCLMPFAINEATEFINPTKTLEYMAAGKPIVSTAIRDVVRNFTPVVSVGSTHEDFIQAVRAAVHSPDLTLIADGVEIARRSSWENIVCRMGELIREAVEHSPIVSRIEKTPAKSAGAATLANAVELPGT